MFTLTAQELKQGGLTSIKKLLTKTKDFMVQERGKDTCVIVDLEYFNQLKLCELEVAYLKATDDINNGRFKVMTNVAEHVAQILNEIDTEEKDISVTVGNQDASI